MKGAIDLQKVLKISAAVCSLSVSSASFAGTLAFNAGTWGSLTGSGSSDSSAYSVYNSGLDAAPSLTLTSPASGDTYTLGGTYSFGVTWTPASGTDPHPSTVTLTFEKMVSLSAYGTGVAELLSGSTILAEMDSTSNLPAGGQTFLSTLTVTVTLSANGDGTYSGSGSLASDTLSTTYNSGTGGVTKATEIFNMDSMVANS